MLTKIASMVSVAAMAILGYWLTSAQHPSTEHPLAMEPLPATSQEDNRIEAMQRIVEDLRRYQRDSQARFEEAMRRQVEIGASLQQLSKRVERLQTAARENLDQYRRHEPQNSGGQPNSAATPDPGGRNNVSESTLSTWMMQILESGSHDLSLTGQVFDQARSTVQQRLKNVNIDELECEARFCRAVFSSFDGTRPQLRPIFGRPPFMTEGFTMNEGDNRIALYFMQRGTTLAEISQDLRR